VADLDEDALLALVFPLLPRGADTLLGPGDDAAVVTAPDGRVVVSTDVLVAGRHFRAEWSSGADVGWRAAMANLADIAAMGARPTAVVVALVLPGHTPVAWVTDLATGLAEACAPHGVGVVGGDLSGGDQIVVSVTVLGDLAGRAPVRRVGARPGDVVGHAGVLGHSAAGLALLRAGLGGEHARFVEAYLRPCPPVEAGALAAERGATAMIDVSDGLVRDARRLAGASGVLIDLDAGRLADVATLAPVAERLGSVPLEWVLGGGEDHGLLATFPPDAGVPAPFTVIGAVGPRGKSPGSVLVDGAVPAGITGWDHFAG
jgi:thiamine-monophosphate kinase